MKYFLVNALCCLAAVILADGSAVGAEACNWNYSDDPRSGAVWKEGTMPAGPFTDDRLKPAGVEVKRQMTAGRTE